MVIQRVLTVSVAPVAVHEAVEESLAAVDAGRSPVKIREELAIPLAALWAGKGSPVVMKVGSPLENINRRVEEALWSLRSRLEDSRRRRK